MSQPQPRSFFQDTLIPQGGSYRGAFVVGAAPPVSGDWSQGDVCWNSAPSAGLPAGWICVTAGTPGTWATFGGTAAPYVLAKSGVAVVTPADTTEDILVTVNVPANAMGPNGLLRVRAVWSCVNNANAKTGRIRFSGPAGTLYIAASFASVSSGEFEATIWNRGATNSQTGAPRGVNSAGAVYGAVSVTSAVDTTAATTVVFTGQKAVGGDALTLESYLVELTPG